MEARAVPLFALALFGSGCAVVSLPAFWGSIVVLLLTVGIFYGTLSLGRAPRPGASATASQSGSGT